MLKFSIPIRYKKRFTYHAKNNINSVEASSWLDRERVQAGPDIILRDCRYCINNEFKQLEMSIKANMRDEQRESEHFNKLKRELVLAELEEKAIELRTELDRRFSDWS